MANILLIEPDKFLARTYAEFLHGQGHRVTVAAGAQTAVYAADRQQPDLIILELQMVEHSGIEFLYEFRSYPEWQAIPVIVQSLVPPAEFNDSWRVFKEELGISDYLYKPQAKLSHLAEAINQQLVPA